MQAETIIEMIDRELDELLKDGFNRGNLDTVGKLVDICKDLAEVNTACDVNVTSHKNGPEGGGYSRYCMAKRAYHNDMSTDAQDVLMDAITSYMDEVTGNIESMIRDADTAEERQMIQRYLRRLRN